MGLLNELPIITEEPTLVFMQLSDSGVEERTLAVTGIDVQRFHRWLDQVLRFEDNRVARNLLVLTNHTVYDIGWNKGRTAADDGDADQIGWTASASYRRGYEDGLAAGQGD